MADSGNTRLQPVSTTWRLSAARLQLWPTEPPSVQPYHHGWVHRGNERMLRQLIQEHQPKVIVELGSWLGLCTNFLLSASSGAAVFAIDKWDATFLLQEQFEQYARDREALGLLRGADGEPPLPLHDTFLVNMWPWRTRLFPLRMGTAEGLKLIASIGAPVGLIYVDADHTHDGVLADLREAAHSFPSALVCGDDWQWPGVRSALEQHVVDNGGRLKIMAHPAENWWWLATQHQQDPGSNEMLSRDA